MHDYLCSVRERRRHHYRGLPSNNPWWLVEQAALVFKRLYGSTGMSVLRKKLGQIEQLEKDEREGKNLARIHCLSAGNVGDALNVEQQAFDCGNMDGCILLDSISRQPSCHICGTAVFDDELAAVMRCPCPKRVQAFNGADAARPKFCRVCFSWHDNVPCHPLPSNM